MEHIIESTKTTEFFFRGKNGTLEMTSRREHHFNHAAKRYHLRLTADEIRSLEELYEPHNLSGVMAQNTPAARATEQVWIKNGKYRK